MDTKAAFETWLKEKMPTTYRYVFEVQEEDDEEMTNHFKASVLDMRTAWEAAWTASRAEIECELPDPDMWGDEQSVQEYSEMTEQSLQAIGIRIKGKAE